MILLATYSRFNALDRRDVETPRASSRIAQATEHLRVLRSSRASEDEIRVAQLAVVDARFSMMDARRSAPRRSSGEPGYTPMPDGEPGQLISIYA